VLYVLNTLVIPADYRSGERVVRIRQISVEEAKAALRSRFVSAVGHEGTASALSKLLGIQIPYNRISVWMRPGDAAIHYYLKDRLPVGADLTEEQVKKLPYDLVFSQVIQ